MVTQGLCKPEVLLSSPHPLIWCYEIWKLLVFSNNLLDHFKASKTWKEYFYPNANHDFSFLKAKLYFHCAFGARVREKKELYQLSWAAKMISIAQPALRCTLLKNSKVLFTIFFSTIVIFVYFFRIFLLFCTRLQNGLLQSPE